MAYRKRLQTRHHTCGLCHPAKMRLEPRWKSREAQALREWEREQREQDWQHDGVS